MGWNGSGTFNRLHSWIADAAAGLDISSVRTDADTNDIASAGFGNCLTRDGQGQATANLPMAGFRHTGVGNGVAVSDYAALGQAQDGLLNWTTAGGTVDVITATYTPAITALTDGLLLSFRATGANLTTTPTFSPNGLTAKTITRNGIALVPGDIRGPSFDAMVRYNSSGGYWSLINAMAVPIGGVVPYFGGTVPGDFILPQGQNLAIAAYPALNAVIGTTYGNPGGGNISAPDLRGRVFAGLDAGGSARITVAGGNFDGTVLGNTGGSQSRTTTTTLVAGNIPQVSTAYTPAGTNSGTQGFLNVVQQGAGVLNNGGSAPALTTSTLTVNFANATFAGTPATITVGSGSPSAATSGQFSTLPPIMTINVMMRAF